MPTVKKTQLSCVVSSRMSNRAHPAGTVSRPSRPWWRVTARSRPARRSSLREGEATMKAARLFGVDDLRVVDVPTPAIGNGEVLIRVYAALICGTDVRMLKNGAKVAPLTLGHELAGVIEEVGRDVRGYRPGMRVAVAPNYGCGVCDPCVSGQGQNCGALRALGIHD